MDFPMAIETAIRTTEKRSMEWNYMLEMEWVRVIYSIDNASSYGRYSTAHHFSPEVSNTPRVQDMLVSRLLKLGYAVNTHSEYFKNRDPMDQGFMIHWQHHAPLDSI